MTAFNVIAVIVFLGALGLLAELIKQAPTIARTFAEARAAGRYNRIDVEIAVAAAIDRTAAPDVGPNLRDRTAQAVLDDLDRGRLAAYALELRR